MQPQGTEVSNRGFDFRTCVVEGTFGTLLANYRAKNTFGRISHQFSIFFIFRGCNIDFNSMTFILVGSESGNLNLVTNIGDSKHT